MHITCLPTYRPTYLCMYVWTYIQTNRQIHIHTDRHADIVFKIGLNPLVAQPVSFKSKILESGLEM